MLWLLGAFWRDHHTAQTWYRCSSSSWLSTGDVLLFPFSFQRQWLCILLGGGMVRLWMWSNVNQSSCEMGQWNRMWLIVISPPHILYSSIWFNNQGDITTLFKYFQGNDKAASLEILLVSFQASDFQSGFVLLGGRAFVVMKGAENVLTHVLQNRTHFLGNSRRVQI